jgi:hypothetical protein
MAIVCGHCFDMHIVLPALRLITAWVVVLAFILGLAGDWQTFEATVLGYGAVYHNTLWNYR